MESCLRHRVPLCNDFKDYLSLGGIAGSLPPSSLLAIFPPNTFLPLLLPSFTHKKKLVALEAGRVAGGLIRFLVENGGKTEESEELVVRTLGKVGDSDPTV